MHEILCNSLEQSANARRLVRLHVQIVHEEHEHPARCVVARACRRQNDPFDHRCRRRHLQVERPPALNEHQRRDLLPDPVLFDDEVVLGQVRDELAAPITNDHVVRDERHVRSEGGLIVPGPKQRWNLLRTSG